MNRLLRHLCVLLIALHSNVCAQRAINHYFVIVVPSYNNIIWCKKNLQSIFDQKYPHYHVIYLDDCSTDMTYDLVKKYISDRNMLGKVTLVRNKKRLHALANHYKAVHMCQDHHIIVQLDGDDWFKHDHVLDKLNEVYQKKNVWLTYGQFEIYPFNVGKVASELSKDVIMHSAYRESPWVTSALRTFYAGLCKRIHIKDLFNGNDFFAYTCDMALMFPMLEMAAGRIAFINEVLYVYNCFNPINDFKKNLMQQLECERIIRSKNKYNPLNTLPYDEACLGVLPTDLFHDACQ